MVGRQERKVESLMKGFGSQAGGVGTLWGPVKGLGPGCAMIRDIFTE